MTMKHKGKFNIDLNWMISSITDSSVFYIYAR